MLGYRHDDAFQSLVCLECFCIFFFGLNFDTISLIQVVNYFFWGGCLIFFFLNVISVKVCNFQNCCYNIESRSLINLGLLCWFIQYFFVYIGGLHVSPLATWWQIWWRIPIVCMSGMFPQIFLWTFHWHNTPKYWIIFFGWLSFLFFPKFYKRKVT